MENGTVIHPQELSLRWIKTAARERINCLGLHPVGGPEADRYLSEMLVQLRDPAFVTLLDTAAAHGLRIEYDIHAMRWLLPAAEFDAHPGWFRMDAQGNRVSDFNLCVSDPEALDFVAARAVALAKQLSHSGNRYHFWFDDAKDCVCHCPRCAALSPSDQQLTVMNHIVAALRAEVDPEAQLAYLAYQDFITPPAAVRPAPGIYLEYAPIERNMHLPLTDGSYAPLLGNLRALLDFFGAENANVLEYWLDNSMFSGWKKPPKPFVADEPVIAADIGVYRGLGFERIFTFACYLGEDYVALYGPPEIHGFAACRD